MQGEDAQQTVFTVRFSTSYARGSGLDAPCAGVQLCLISADGRGVLHRVSPTFNPQALASELDNIRRVCLSQYLGTEPLVALAEIFSSAE